jgi:hypothetical protein
MLDRRLGASGTLLRRSATRIRALGRFSRLSASVQLPTQLVALPFGLFAPPTLVRQLFPQRGLGSLRELQADAELGGLGRLLYKPVGKLADSITATLRGNIRAFGRYAVVCRRLSLPLPRVPERLEAINGDEPATAHAFAFRFSLKIVLLDMPADSPRRDA